MRHLSRLINFPSKVKLTLTISNLLPFLGLFNNVYQGAAPLFRRAKSLFFFLLSFFVLRLPSIFFYRALLSLVATLRATLRKSSAPTVFLLPFSGIYSISFVRKFMCICLPLLSSPRSVPISPHDDIADNGWSLTGLGVNRLCLCIFFFFLLNFLAVVRYSHLGGIWYFSCLSVYVTTLAH